MVKVWAYGVYNRCNALVRINDNYIHLFGQELAKMCPNQYIVNDTLMYQPLAFASDGATVDLNAISWDFIVMRKSTTGNLTALLQIQTASEAVQGARTGLPGYRMNDPLVILWRAP
jgi:hypothetical protein